MRDNPWLVVPLLMEVFGAPLVVFVLWLSARKARRSRKAVRRA